MAKFETKHKVIGVPIQKSVEKTSKGTLVVRGFFTSDNKDEVGDIITRAATERAIPKYKQWSNIRLMHQPIPVGKVIRIGSTDGLEWNEIEIEVIEPAAVFMVENDLLSALSVGALIKMDDVDLMEDGGMIINDYTLAEISLVDHPANYDAFLKHVPIEQGLRTLVTNYGMDALARSMKSLIEMEIAMTDQTEKTADLDAVGTEPEVEKAQEPAEAPVQEELPVEKQAIDEAPAEAEAAEEPAEEPAPEPEAEEITEEKEISNAEIVSMIRSLTESVEKLSSAFAEFQKGAVKAEAPAEQEQAGEAPDMEKAAAMKTGIEGEPEPGPAANRESAMAETKLPGATEQTKDEPVTDLRQALRKYLLSKNK